MFEEQLHTTILHKKEALETTTKAMNQEIIDLTKQVADARQELKDKMKAKEVEMEEFKRDLLSQVDKEKKDEMDRIRGKYELQVNDLRGMVEDAKRIAMEKEDKIKLLNIGSEKLRKEAEMLNLRVKQYDQYRESVQEKLRLMARTLKLLGQDNQMQKQEFRYQLA